MSTLLFRHAESAAHFDDARREPRGASGLRRFELEPRFGREFGAVRVHTDTKAAESAAAIDRSGGSYRDPPFRRPAYLLDLPKWCQRCWSTLLTMFRKGCLL
jgi:hypothetical protein